MQRRTQVAMHTEIIVIAWITMLVLEDTSASARMDNIDECAESGSSPCDSNSICMNNIGSYNCSCPKGYHGDGRRYGNGCIPSKIINIFIGIFLIFFFRYTFK